MKNHKEQMYLDFKIKDSHSKKLDEGFMSIDKAMAVLRKFMKKKCR